MQVKVGDRVKTPDGRTITVQGVLQVTGGPVYRASECQVAHAHKDGVDDQESHPAEEDQQGNMAEQTDASRSASAGAGVGMSKAAASATGDAIIWGT